MSNNPLTPVPSDPLKALLQKYEPSFRKVIGDRTPQFASSVIQLANSSRQLKACKPESIVAAAMTAAVLDLPIDKNLGFAHIVPYGGLAQFQLGYKGIIQLALRSGQYEKMNAKAINAEAFGGYDEVGDPMIDWAKLDETKEPIGYAFAWRLTTGFVKCVYWTKEKIEKHAGKYSQAFKAKKSDSPWFTNFNAMALKTVVKDGISHWGIMSVQLQRAVVEDQGAHVSVGDESIIYPDNADEPQMTALPEPKTQPPVETQAQVVEQKQQPVDESPQTAPAASVQQSEQKPQQAADEIKEAQELVKKIASLSLESGVNENQVLAYAQKNKLAGRSCSEIAQMANSKMKLLVDDWPNIVEKIKQYPQG